MMSQKPKAGAQMRTYPAAAIAAPDTVAMFTAETAAAVAGNTPGRRRCGPGRGGDGPR